MINAEMLFVAGLKYMAHNSYLISRGKLDSIFNSGFMFP